MAEEQGFTPGSELRVRNIGTTVTDDETAVYVDHVYAPEGTLGNCDNPECDHDARDPGFIGLVIQQGAKDSGASLTAHDALEIANRLQRAASLVLEFGEDVPDIEREAAKFAVVADIKE